MLSEPANAQLLGSGTPQERTPEGAPASSHPAFEPHPIQGWTPDFIPKVLQEAIDRKFYDDLVPVPGPEGIAWSKRLAAEEGSEGRRGSVRVRDPDVSGHHADERQEPSEVEPRDAPSTPFALAGSSSAPRRGGRIA